MISEMQYNIGTISFKTKAGSLPSHLTSKSLKPAVKKKKKDFSLSISSKSITIILSLPCGISLYNGLIHGGN